MRFWGVGNLPFQFPQQLQYDYIQPIINLPKSVNQLLLIFVSVFHHQVPDTVAVAFC
jgi:hypothetical protein